MTNVQSRPDTPRNRGDYDAPHQSPVTPAEDWRTVMINRASLSAVVCGASVALASQIVLNMFGVAVGLATLNPAGSDNPSASSFSIGGGLWWTISGILAALIGGYVAGRLCGQPKESSAATHGLAAWALGTLALFYMLTSAAGTIAGGAYQAMGGMAGSMPGAASQAAQLAAPTPLAITEQSIRQTLGGDDQAAARENALTAVRIYLTSSPANADQARTRAEEAVARARNIPPDQARAQVQQFEQQYRQAVDQTRQQASRAADTAARAGSTAALFGAIGLLLGAIAGWLGGRMGTVEPTITRHFQEAWPGDPLEHVRPVGSERTGATTPPTDTTLRR